MKFNFFAKKETEENRFIRYADIMVANSDYTGELEKDCLDIIGIITKSELPPPLANIRNELRTCQPPNVSSDGKTIHLDITTDFIQSNYDNVKKHLLNNDYIESPDHTRKWILSAKGKLMKELGGHENYKKYRLKELHGSKHKYFTLDFWIEEILKHFLKVVLVAAGAVILLIWKCTYQKWHREPKSLIQEKLIVPKYNSKPKDTVRLKMQSKT